MRAGMGALFVFPFWVRRASAAALAKLGGSGLAGGVAMTAKAGAIAGAVVVVAGGAVELNRHARHVPAAHASVPAAAAAGTALRAQPVSGRYGVPAPRVERTRRSSRPPVRQVTVAPVRATVPATTAAPRTAAPRTTPPTTPPKPATSEPAPTVSDPVPAEPPRSDPAPPATEPVKPAPPADSGPPPALFALTSYDQSPGFGGMLTLQRISNGEQVPAYFGEHTDLRCWYTGGPAPAKLETCTKDHLIPGTQVAEAAHEINASSGADVWTQRDAEDDDADGDYDDVHQDSDQRDRQAQRKRERQVRRLGHVDELRRRRNVRVRALEAVGHYLR
jgi:hypothetical protein